MFLSWRQCFLYSMAFTMLGIGVRMLLRGENAVSILTSASILFMAAGAQKRGRRLGRSDRE